MAGELPAKFRGDPQPSPRLSTDMETLDTDASLGPGWPPLLLGATRQGQLDVPPGEEGLEPSGFCVPLTYAQASKGHLGISHQS